MEWRLFTRQIVELRKGIIMVESRRVAIITDASHPAAEAVAKKLEDNGIVVVRNYPAGLPEGLSEDKGFYYSYDTCSPKEMEQLLGSAAEKAGNVKYLIHSDNYIYRSSIEDISEEDFKTTVDRNAKSAFISTKVIANGIARNGGGAILYLSSLHDEKPTASAFAYSVGRGAVKMLSKEMALYFGRKGVRSNLIEMDYTKEQEELLDSMISPFNYDAGTKIPLRRLAKPEDFAGLAWFLLSDEASFINGADIRVDGGHLLYYGDR